MWISYYTVEPIFANGIVVLVRPLYSLSAGILQTNSTSLLPIILKKL